MRRYAVIYRHSGKVVRKVVRGWSRAARLANRVARRYQTKAEVVPV